MYGEKAQPSAPPAGVVYTAQPGYPQMTTGIPQMVQSVPQQQLGVYMCTISIEEKAPGAYFSEQFPSQLGGVVHPAEFQHTVFVMNCYLLKKNKPEVIFRSGGGDSRDRAYRHMQEQMARNSQVFAELRKVLEPENNMIYAPRGIQVTVEGTGMDMPSVMFKWSGAHPPGPQHPTPMTQPPMSDAEFDRICTDNLSYFGFLGTIKTVREQAPIMAAIMCVMSSPLWLIFGWNIMGLFCCCICYAEKKRLEKNPCAPLGRKSLQHLGHAGNQGLAGQQCA